MGYDVVPIWTLTIQGFGPHHPDVPEDAATLARRFVAHLEAQGHAVTAALISTPGGAIADLRDPARPEESHGTR